jgi:hypothetical protein
VIDPGVRIEDVDPDGFALVNAVLARRDRAAPSPTVLLEPEGLDDLSAKFVDAARSTDDQGLLLAECSRIWTGQPSRWDAVQAALDNVPDGSWLKADMQSFVLAAQVAAGRIVRITSELPADARVALGLRGTEADLEAVLLAGDPLAEARARFEMEGETAWPG